MIKIILSELQRDHRTIIYSLLVFPVTVGIAYGYQPYLETKLILCIMAALIWGPGISTSFAGTAFRICRNDQSQEYYLSLNLERWKIWFAKLIYLDSMIALFSVMSYFTLWALTLPYMDEKPPLFVAIGFAPKILYAYIYLIWLSSFAVLSLTPQINRPGIVFMSIFAGIGCVLAVLAVTGRVDFRWMIVYWIFTAPVGAGFLVFAMGASAFGWCHYRLNLKTAAKLAGIFAGASALFIGVQWANSAANLDSRNDAERMLAISAFLPVNREKARPSFEEAFLRAGMDYTAPYARLLQNDEGTVRVWRDLWLKGLFSGNNETKRASLYFLSTLGEDDDLADKVLAKVAEDKSYLKGPFDYTWLGEGIALLTPRDTLKDRTMSQLQSDNHRLNRIGLEMSAYFPDDDYVPLIIDMARRSGKPKMIYSFSGPLSVISMGELQSISAWSTNKLIDDEVYRRNCIETWEQWYGGRKEATFEQRFDVFIAKHGSAEKYRTITPLELYRISLHGLYGDSGYSGAVMNMMRHQLKVGRYFLSSRVSTDDLIRARLGLTPEMVEELRSKRMKPRPTADSFDEKQ